MDILRTKDTLRCVRVGELKSHVAAETWTRSESNGSGSIRTADPLLMNRLDVESEFNLRRFTPSRTKDEQLLPLLPSGVLHSSWHFRLDWRLERITCYALKYVLRCTSQTVRDFGSEKSCQGAEKLAPIWPRFNQVDSIALEEPSAWRVRQDQIKCSTVSWRKLRYFDSGFCQSGTDLLITWPTLETLADEISFR